MYFLVSDVVSKVRTKLAELDATNSFFSDSDIINSINDNLLILCRDMGITSKNITLNVNSTDNEYNLPDDVIEVNNVWMIYNNIRYEFKYIEFDDYLKLSDNINISSSLLSYYYIRNEIDKVNKEFITKIGFYPKPNSSFVVYLKVLTKIDKVSQSTDKIPLPENYMLLLTYLVLSDLLENDKRYDEAMYYYQRYKDRRDYEISKERNKIVEYVE